MLAGVDEAGRGAVLGPLVVAGVLISPEKEALLKKLGVRDSKLLSPKRREELAKKIEAAADHIVVVKLTACRIDNSKKAGVNLNRLEVEKFADVLNLLKPQRAVVDAADVKPERFASDIRAQLDPALKAIPIVSEHKADANHVVVAAASIIAKVERDADIAELAKKLGDIGPGYSSNDVTVAWLKQWWAAHKSWPDEVRKSWATIRDIEGPQQKGILGFLHRRKEPGCDPEPKE